MASFRFLPPRNTVKQFEGFLTIPSSPIPATESETVELESIDKTVISGALKTQDDPVFSWNPEENLAQQSGRVGSLDNQQLSMPEVCDLDQAAALPLDESFFSTGTPLPPAAMSPNSFSSAEVKLTPTTEPVQFAHIRTLIKALEFLEQKKFDLSPANVFFDLLQDLIDEADIAKWRKQTLPFSPRNLTGKYEVLFANIIAFALEVVDVNKALYKTLTVMDEMEILERPFKRKKILLELKNYYNGDVNSQHIPYQISPILLKNDCFINTMSSEWRYYILAAKFVALEVAKELGLPIQVTVSASSLYESSSTLFEWSESENSADSDSEQDLVSDPNYTPNESPYTRTTFFSLRPTNIHTVTGKRKADDQQQPARNPPTKKMKV